MSARKKNAGRANKAGTQYRSGLRLNLLYLALALYLPLFLWMMLRPGSPDKAQALFGPAGSYAAWGLFAVASFLVLQAWRWAFGPDVSDRRLRG